MGVLRALPRRRRRPAPQASLRRLQDIGMGEASKSRRQKTILDLDDACLTRVFRALDPLPDMFNAARACSRFRDLLHTRCAWLVVGHEPCPSAAAAPPRCRARYATLAEAVAASRPGDTILLEPTPSGRPHDAAGIAIRHPLRLLGGGDAPAECVLRCPVRGLPALSFTASARLSNLTIEGDGLAGAVAHHAGRLQLEDCDVQCCARGLPHLAAPIVCMAAAPRDGGGNGTGTAAVAAAPRDGRLNSSGPSAGSIGGLNSPQVDVATPPQPVPGCRSGPGTVAVAGCALEGGGSAVRLCGGATLRAVRVVYEAHKALFWFEVEAAGGGSSSREERCSGGVAFDFETSAATPAAGPSWLRSDETQKFDPRALQAQVDAMMAGAGASLPLPPTSGAVDVEKKAQAWRAGHRAAVASSPHSCDSTPSD